MGREWKKQVGWILSLNKNKQNTSERHLIYGVLDDTVMNIVTQCFSNGKCSIIIS